MAENYLKGIMEKNKKIDDCPYCGFVLFEDQRLKYVVTIDMKICNVFRCKHCICSFIMIEGIRFEVAFRRC